MTFEQALQAIRENPDETGTIYAKQPWHPEAEAIIVDQDESDDVTLGPYRYVLEADLVHHVLEAWSVHRDGRRPSDAEACEAVLHYARNDAYLLPSGAE